MSTLEIDSPAALPVPEGFPVDWKDPEDERAFWTRDRMHQPNQITPLAHSWDHVFMQGFRDFAEELSLPLGGIESQLINTYPYQAMRPLFLAPEEMQAREKEAGERMMAAVQQGGRLWREQYLPEVLDALDHFRAFDLASATVDDLLAYLDDMLKRFGRVCTIHFLAAVPAMVAMSEFEELYIQLFPSDDRFAAHRLLRGFSTRTFETGAELWRLSRKARSSDVIRGILESEPVPDVREALSRSEDGRSFVADLEAYLTEYGERGDLWSITHPTWIEDPAPVIKNLKEYMTQPDDADPIRELERAASEREAAVAEVRQRLEEYPDDARGAFEGLLRAAQDGVVVTEDHGFYIDFAGFYQVRRLCLAFGERFAEAGVIDDRDDVFMLFLEELVETARTLPSVDRRDLVAERKVEWERFASVDEPDALGTPPPHEPPDNPMTRTFGKFWGRPREDGDSRDVQGIPGAPGSARGTARIITSIADAERLEPGDVLVAQTTAPPWTPLFAFASAVVTDTGGVLSHCAVVAREYGIPAVVGCIDATTRISDGQVVAVDGTAGVVRVVG